jgi:hypothetical protein
MIREFMPLLGFALVVGCGSDSPPARDHPPAGARTSSSYSMGSDSGAARQQLEGSNTGVEFEAPRRTPGVLAALDQFSRQPDKQNLTALRGNLGSLEDAMRNDLSRVGLADTGEFHTLTDSISRDIGGGPGGLSEPDSGDVSKLQARVNRLIQVHGRMMASVRK